MPEEVLQSGGGGGDAEEAGGVGAPDPLYSDVADALSVQGTVDLGYDVVGLISRLSLILTLWMSSKHLWSIVGRGAGDCFLGALAALLVSWTTAHPASGGGGEGQLPQLGT